MSIVKDKYQNNCQKDEFPLLLMKYFHFSKIFYKIPVLIGNALQAVILSAGGISIDLNTQS